MQTFFLSIASLFMVLIIPVFENTYAKPLKEQYELQERCGKRAEEWFKEKYPPGAMHDKDGHWLCNYKNHYNSKLNKCFILTTSTKYGKNGVYLSKQLLDINSNKIYGDCSGSIDVKRGFVYPAAAWCEVLDTTCHSENEWDSLVKPYMAE